MNPKITINPFTSKASIYHEYSQRIHYEDPDGLSPPIVPMPRTPNVLNLSVSNTDKAITTECIISNEDVYHHEPDSSPETMDRLKASYYIEPETFSFHDTPSLPPLSLLTQSESAKHRKKKKRESININEDSDHDTKLNEVELKRRRIKKRNACIPSFITASETIQSASAKHINESININEDSDAKMSKLEDETAPKHVNRKRDRKRIKNRKIKNEDVGYRGSMKAYFKKKVHAKMIEKMNADKCK